MYRAYDTIEGVPVALKIPYTRLLTKETLDDFRKEVRLSSRPTAIIATCDTRLGVRRARAT